MNNLVAPTWPITLANLMLIIQVIGCYQVCDLPLGITVHSTSHVLCAFVQTAIFTPRTA